VSQAANLAVVLTNQETWGQGYILGFVCLQCEF